VQAGSLQHEQAPDGSQRGAGGGGAPGLQGGALALAPAPGEISEIIGRAGDEEGVDAGEDEIHESSDFEDGE
jgi:hypothetical protein